MAKVLEFPADRIAKGVYSYTPEMGQRKPNCQMKVTIGHYGSYYIDTSIELKGRGIKLLKQYKNEDLTGPGQYMAGWFSYRVTDLAYDKLKAQYSISHESLLD
jgi:hypothetical protein